VILADGERAHIVRIILVYPALFHCLLVARMEKTKGEDQE
jgi:hypothetical protein